MDFAEQLQNVQKLKSPFLKPGQENILVRTFEETSTYMIENYGQSEEKYYYGFEPLINPVLAAICKNDASPAFPEIAKSGKNDEFITRINGLKDIAQVSPSEKPTGQNVAEHAGAEMAMAVLLMINGVQTGKRFDFTLHLLLAHHLEKYLNLLQKTPFAPRAEFLLCSYNAGMLKDEFLGLREACRQKEAAANFDYNEGSVLMAYALGQLDNFMFTKQLQAAGKPVDPDFQNASLGNLRKWYNDIPEMKYIIEEAVKHR